MGGPFCQSLFSQHSFITLVVVVVFIASYFETSISPPETHRLIVSHILCLFPNFRSSGIPRFSQGREGGREGAWVVNELSMSCVCLSFKTSSVWMIYQNLYNNNTGARNEPHTCRVCQGTFYAKFKLEFFT